MQHRTALVGQAIELVAFMDRRELEQLTGELIVIAGMSENFTPRIPRAVEGTPWDACFDRGLKRLAGATLPA